MGEIVLGGILALILINRIKKEDPFTEREKVLRPAGVESRELANRV
jgi:hypothetical protein